MGAPQAAGGEEATVSVRWRAPAECPDAARVQEQIAALAPVRFVAAPAAALHVEADVESQGPGYAVRLILRSAEQTRTRHLAAEDCALLGRAVAVVTAVALDPVTAASRVQMGPAAVPEVTPLPPVAPPVAAPAEPAEEPASGELGEAEIGELAPLVESSASRDRPSRRRSFETSPSTAPPGPAVPVPSARSASRLDYGSRFGLGVGGLVLPQAGAGITASPYIGVRHFIAALAVEYWPPRDATLAGVADAGARFQLVSTGVRGCPVIDAGRVRFPLCAGVDLGALIGVGHGAALTRSFTATDLWVGVILQPGIEVALTPRLGIFAAFEGAVSLLRPRYHVENNGPQPLFHAGAFGPRGLVGLVVFNRRRFL